MSGAEKRIREGRCVTVSMGNLLGSWRFKEPSTIEECDSTWGSDSESEEPEDDSGISGSVSPADSDRDGSPQVPAALCGQCGCVLGGCGGVGVEKAVREGSRAPCCPQRSHMWKPVSHICVNMTSARFCKRT